MVEHRRVANAVAAARLRDQVGRAGHRFHAARNDDVGAASHQLVVREDGRLHRRAAHLGERHGAGGHRQAGLEQRLACRGLALAGHQAVAEVDVFDGGRIDAGALHGGLDRDGAQITGGLAGKIALEGAHRGARGADDNDWIIHC